MVTKQHGILAAERIEGGAVSSLIPTPTRHGFDAIRVTFSMFYGVGNDLIESIQHLKNIIPRESKNVFETKHI